jgi:hypothetical protein
MDCFASLAMTDSEPWHGAKSVFSYPYGLSYGLPIGGLIFYGDRESAGLKFDNSINIKGLAVAKSLWRLP